MSVVKDIRMDYESKGDVFFVIARHMIDHDVPAIEVLRALHYALMRVAMDCVPDGVTQYSTEHEKMILDRLTGVNKHWFAVVRKTPKAAVH